MSINRNNFLRWSGELESFPFQNIASDFAVAMPTGFDYVDADVLPSCYADFGVNVNSIRFTYKSNGNAPNPIWISSTNRLRIFRPTTGGPYLNMQIGYMFDDNLGNTSNQGLIAVDLSLLFLGWRGYEPSKYCEQNSFQQNTGRKAWSILERYFLVSGNAFVPQELKPNVPSDPNYIAPIMDTTLCPLVGTYPVTVLNQLDPGTGTVTLLRWRKTGQPDFLVPMNVAPGSTFTYNMVNGIFDQVFITFAYGSNPVVVTFIVRYTYGTSGILTNTFPNGNNTAITAPVHTAPSTTIKLSR